MEGIADRELLELGGAGTGTGTATRTITGTTGTGAGEGLGNALHLSICVTPSRYME